LPSSGFDPHGGRLAGFESSLFFIVPLLFDPSLRILGNTGEGFKNLETVKMPKIQMPKMLKLTAGFYRLLSADSLLSRPKKSAFYISFCKG
jgi:hypothetical protein